jgi:hypothetical protein
MAISSNAVHGVGEPKWARRNSSTLAAVAVGNLRSNKPRVGIAEKTDIVTFFTSKIDKHVPIAIGAIEDVEDLAELTKAHFPFLQRLTGFGGKPQTPGAFTIERLDLHFGTDTQP